MQDDRHFANRKTAYQYSKTPKMDYAPCKNEKSAEANQHRVDIEVQFSKVRYKVHGINKYQKTFKNSKCTDCKNMQ